MSEGSPRRPLWRSPARLWRERRRLAIALLAGVVALAAGVAIAYEALKRPADVHNAAVAFKAPPKPPKPKPKVKTVDWPMFGYNLERTRYLAAPKVHPPYRLLWHFVERPLQEYPPIYAKGRIFFVNNSGVAWALDANTGKVLWHRKVGLLNASSPTYYKGHLFIVNLVPGHVVKLDAKNGRELWKRSLPGRAESSPAVVGDTLYFGCENDQLFALSTGSGRLRWATTLGGPVKSAPAYRDGVLYVGDYGGYMNAVSARTGKLIWQTASLGQGFGTSGEFYSTPALAFGRVYAGNNDHRIYSFSQKTGALAWSHSTGGYVYSGPAVASTPHSPPTVYIGSFDGNIYALNAKNGETRWAHSAGGSVVGSLSAIGNIVYVAEFSTGDTNGYDMRTGRLVFHYPTGTYTPVISDGRRIYLVGYSSINALQPFTPKPKRPAHGGGGRGRSGGAARRGANRRQRPAPRSAGRRPGRPFPGR